MSDTNRRSLDAEELSRLGLQIIEDCKNGEFPDGIISAKKARGKYKVALNVLKEAMLEVYGNGFTGHKLVDDLNASETYSNPTINKRGGIMIGKKAIIDLNKTLPEDQQFKEGDTFIPSATSGRIVLTLQSD